MSHHKGLAKPIRASFKQVRMSSNDSKSENMHACYSAKLREIQIEETACTCMCITNIPCSGGSAWWHEVLTKFALTSLVIKDLGHSFFQEVKQAAIMKREYRLYSRKFSMDLLYISRISWYRLWPNSWNIKPWSTSKVLHMQILDIAWILLLYPFNESKFEPLKISSYTVCMHAYTDKLREIYS